MARPKSENKRIAILDAATRVIVTHGLGAPTAAIAKEAGVANGSLFTYFETKKDLFNELYLELKTDMVSAALGGLPAGAELRDQLFHLWSNWMDWGLSHPEKQQVLLQLEVSEELTPETRAEGHKIMAGFAGLLEKSRANGPLRDAPKGFVIAILRSLAEATLTYMSQDPGNAKKHCEAGFDALWRILA
jgi:AcrR family transcriptional regulator